MLTLFHRYDFIRAVWMYQKYEVFDWFGIFNKNDSLFITDRVVCAELIIFVVKER